MVKIAAVSAFAVKLAGWLVTTGDVTTVKVPAKLVMLPAEFVTTQLYEPAFADWTLFKSSVDALAPARAVPLNCH